MTKKSSCISLFICSLLILGSNVHAGDSCIECHGNPEKMKEAGYPQFILSVSGVKAQTRMPASCTECHMGNSQAITKEDAHKGILTVRAVRQNTWETVTRAGMGEDLKEWPNLEPTGSNRAKQLLPKRMYDGKLQDNPDYRLIILHDKNAETLAFHPDTAEKTCGKCHRDVVKSFLKSPMGGGKGAHTQSQYRIWTGSSGPQSCGLWVGALSQPNQESFTDKNVGYFNEHSTMPISEETAHNVQRTCNQCHAGCLDCHLDVRKEDKNNPGKGPHTFTRKPSPLSCYGGGRGFLCHAGPLERRRGDGFIRGEFTQASPEGTESLRSQTDVHMRNNIFCVDCHEPNMKTGYHGDLRRDVRCEKCHKSVVEAHRKGPHRKVDCASCHTSAIGGYAFNFWSAVGPKGRENPITRIQDYTTGSVQPLLIKNPEGLWIPVHVVPHISGNVKAGEVKLSGRLLFRNRPDSDIDRLYLSNDSYVVTGLIRDLDSKDHDTMVWLNLDRVAHATGRSRRCESCHASSSQKISVKFAGGSYKDVDDGEYTIIADEKGLRIADMKGPDGNPIAKGLEPLKDKWELKGDFSMPRIRNKRPYESIRKDFEEGTFVH